MLTKEQILKADDLKFEEIDVPEWGGKVRIKTLKGSERDSFEDSITESKGRDTTVNMRNLRAKLCALTIVDGNGDRVFNERDIPLLGKKSAKVLDRIFSVAQELSGIGEKDIETLAKNSEAAQNEDSTSD